MAALFLKSSVDKAGAVDWLEFMAACVNPNKRSVPDSFDAVRYHSKRNDN